MEKEILRTVQQAISSAIAKSFDSYNSPLHKMVADVVISNQESIKQTIHEALTGVLNNAVLRATIQEEFQRKVAKTLVSELESSVAKAAGAIKSDPTLKARMILSLQQMIDQDA